MSNTDVGLRSEETEGHESGGLVDFSTVKAQSISKTMKELAPISSKDADLWIKYWKNVGLFA